MAETLGKFNGILGGGLLPLLLLSVGIILGCRVKFFYIFHPVKTLRRAFSAHGEGGVGPIKSTLLALAGTLGVGNIAGVATAITAGGAGAVFWMWMAAFASMGIKFTEVKLGVEHRRFIGGEYRGGAHYYIYERFAKLLGRRGAKAASKTFAVLMICNSLLTGNIVQVSASADVLGDKVPRYAVGIAFALIGAAVATGRTRRAADFSAAVVPIFSAAYTILSIYIIAKNAGILPSVISEIASGAFGLRAVFGGAAGYSVSSAIRYGVTRGIFSNEAGMGTSPAAHASSGAKDADAQGCLGIVEVFVDTILMCTMTALVILLKGDVNAKDGIALAVSAYENGAGRVAGEVIGVSAVAFALASVVCQEFYGAGALEYLIEEKDSRLARGIYVAIGGAASVIGAVISADIMWELADLLVFGMCFINIIAIFPKKVEKGIDKGSVI